MRRGLLALVRFAIDGVNNRLALAVPDVGHTTGVCQHIQHRGCFLGAGHIKLLRDIRAMEINSRIRVNVGNDLLRECLISFRHFLLLAILVLFLKLCNAALDKVQHIAGADGGSAKLVLLHQRSKGIVKIAMGNLSGSVFLLRHSINSFLVCRVSFPLMYLVYHRFGGLSRGFENFFLFFFLPFGLLPFPDYIYYYSRFFGDCKRQNARIREK
nr:MAG TPA: hypothetical protein [Caudoviricetes sp.]